MGPPTAGTDSPSSTKACAACRALKVRCITDNAPGQKRCQRCAKLDRDCVFPVPQKRKQRKRTDARVAELENEMRSMKGFLDRNDDANKRSQRGHSEGVSASSSGNVHSPVVTNGDSNDADFQNASRERQISQPDLFDPATICSATAKNLYEIYNNELVDHFPVVVFPGNYSVESLRAEKPTLFLAVMAAAARKSQPELSTILNKFVLQSYATRIFMNSEKSLELVQSMIVIVVWYSPPDGVSQGQHKYYEYTHMAATMALDLGLGTKPSQTERLESRYPEVESHTSVDTNDVSPQPELNSTNLESRRTFLSCYMISCGVALIMRRPNMLRYNTWIGECVEFLQNSPAAAPSDKRLAAWVQLLSISEEIATGFSFDDLTKIAKIAHPQTLCMLKGFEKRLSQWRTDVNPEMMNGSLAIMYHNTNIYLHEIALHDYRSPEDFKPPYSLEGHRYDKRSTDNTMRHLDAIIQCITSAHILIETFLHMNVELLRTLPIVNYIRLLYAIFVLEMLATSADDASHEYGVFLTRGSLQIDTYSSLLIKHLERVVGPAKCTIPSIILGKLLRLQEWRHRQVLPPTSWLAAEAATPARSEQAMPSLNRAQSSENTVMHPVGTSGDEHTSLGGRRTSDFVSTRTNQNAPLNSAGTTPEASIPHFDPLQGMAFDPIQPVSHLDGHLTQPGTSNGYDAALDFSDDYQMDLDPDNMLLFSGMENITTDTANWAWPMGHDVPTYTS